MQESNWATNRTTGEQVQYQGEKSFDRVEYLLKKYEIQDIIRKTLPPTFTKAGKSRRHRVKSCLSRVAVHGDKHQQAGICRHPDTGHSSWKNLQLCGSAWVCPICAGKISERRAGIIQDVSNQHLAAGGAMLLLTLTFSHRQGQTADDLATKLTGAWSAFAKDRGVLNALESVGCIGGVRSLEVTWGKSNGWHPHLHVLLYVGKWADHPEQRQELQSRLFQRWEAYCKKRKLGLPSEAHGVRVDNGDFASQYVAKHGDWNSAKEITKQNIKKGREGHYKPFELAAMIKVEPENKEWAALFQEYAEAFNGKQQSVWYKLKALKARYKVDTMADIKDENLAEVEIDDLAAVGELTQLEFFRVVDARQRGSALIVAEKEGIESVRRMIRMLPPSEFEKRLITLELYKQDGRVNSRQFDDSQAGRSEFFRYLAKVSKTPKFLAIAKTVGEVGWTSLDPSLWKAQFSTYDG